MTNAKTKLENRQTILEALGTYQKQGADTLNPGEMGDILADESDRGVVVILVSMLEDMILIRLVRGFAGLTPAQVKNLTRAGGLLSNFDDRINLAHALGFLTQDHVEGLQVLKAMRNACAHSRKRIDFQTKVLRDAMALLFTGEGLRDVQESNSPVALRIALMCAVSYFASIVMGDSEEMAQDSAQGVMNAALGYARDSVAKHEASQRKRKPRPAKPPR